MPIKLHNALSRKKEVFKPLVAGRVGLYTCGPTVYNFAHIGNLRTHLFEDILRRVLKYDGYRVRQVMNITDIDDKIIRDARAAGKSIFEFVKEYETAFFEDLTRLNIQRAWKYPKATEHIPEMIGIIKKLIKNGLAYEVEGSVYFSIRNFKKYGALSRLNARKLKTGDRVDRDEYAKDDVQDFALWKAKHDADEPSWSSPWDEGRPGWHIECSAMSMKYLGKTFDIHGGGVDLIFPHHENEIAQSEGATGKKFANFFLEGEHLLVDGRKMSKSLGNTHTLRDLVAQNHPPLAYRYLVLTAHYRSPLNFTWESLAAAEHSLERLYEFVRELRAAPPQQKKSRNDTSFTGALLRVKKQFAAAISDDLDMPRALAAIWSFVRAYRKNPERFDPHVALKLILDFDRVLGLGFKRIQSTVIPTGIQKLAEEREEYRRQKNWVKADELRDRLLAANLRGRDEVLTRIL
ncbi:MAG: cysteine--tRNA ligase, partial [Candidatus Sungbacteria bacterium]|nr:cysteine--tRNA ligase [Candidatus Sungbacteria bacterium]